MTLWQKFIAANEAIEAAQGQREPNEAHEQEWRDEANRDRNLARQMRREIAQECADKPRIF